MVVWPREQRSAKIAIVALAIDPLEGLKPHRRRAIDEVSDPSSWARLGRPNWRNIMDEIKWDDQVQVQIVEPTGIENYQVVEESVIKWDGIDFAEAVKQCMRLSPKERAKMSILAPNGSYGGNEIETLFHRLP